MLAPRWIWYLLARWMVLNCIKDKSQVVMLGASVKRLAKSAYIVRVKYAGVLAQVSIRY